MRFEQYILEKGYFGNKGVGVILKAERTGRILVLQRAIKTMDGGTQTITISGKVDGKESLKQAAIREIKEETRYTDKLYLRLLDVFKDNNDKPEFNEVFEFYTYIATVPYEFEPRLNWEHRHAFWWNGRDKINGEIHFGTKRLLKKYKKRIFR